MITCRMRRKAKTQKMTRKAKKIVMMTSVTIILARKVCRLPKPYENRKVRQA